MSENTSSQQRIGSRQSVNSDLPAEQVIFGLYGISRLNWNCAWLLRPQCDGDGSILKRVAASEIDVESARLPGKAFLLLRCLHFEDVTADGVLGNETPTSR